MFHRKLFSWNMKFRKWTRLSAHNVCCTIFRMYQRKVCSVALYPLHYILKLEVIKFNQCVTCVVWYSLSLKKKVAKLIFRLELFYEQKIPRSVFIFFFRLNLYQTEREYHCYFLFNTMLISQVQCKYITGNLSKFVGPYLKISSVN